MSKSKVNLALIEIYLSYQVAPAELEQLLLQHPNITDAAVVGIPDIEAGELPKAFLVTNDKSLTEHDVHQFVKGIFNLFKPKPAVVKQ